MLAPSIAVAQSAAERAKDAGCVEKPRVVEGSTYKCATASGVMAYFNADSASGSVPGAGASGNAAARKSPTPAGFPKVDGATQKVRDDMRRKVLADELASEQKLLAEARTAYADGAPPPLPEERTDAEKYRARIGKLKQTVTVHERNIEALKKEIALVK